MMNVLCCNVRNVTTSLGKPTRVTCLYEVLLPRIVSHSASLSSSGCGHVEFVQRRVDSNTTTRAHFDL
jgi:hypothetical protein